MTAPDFLADVMQHSQFRGKQDVNAVLRGETPVMPGDIFISESDDMCGFSTLKFNPQLPEPKMPCMHFLVIKRGSFQTCVDAAIAECQDVETTNKV